MNDRTQAIVVFRTGQLFEIDMAANVLKEKGIPHHTREETSGGLTLAMPATPATGPGVWWSLLVPQSFVDTAKKELEQLPFTQGTDPDVWGFKPRPKVKLAWKIYAAVALSLPLVLWIIELFSK
jgi:hypothetical protein